MKYTLFVLFLFYSLFCLADGKAQNKKILINNTEISVKQVFNEIEKQTLYSIGYNETDLDTDKKINLPALNYDLDKLLSLVLRDTGSKYSIKENHIIIISGNKEMVDNGKGMIFNGKVLDKNDNTALAYATVSLMNDNKAITTGVTNDDGLFSVFSHDSISAIRASFVGYETQNRQINNSPDFSTFYLKREPVGLVETQVSANTVMSNIERTSYLITHKMREGTSSAFDLLNKLPAFRVDNMNNTVRTGKNEPVLLLIDGMQQSEDYIKSLPAERIIRMEVVHQPSGRFISENYSAVVNYILKKDYTGFDINIHNSTMINPVKTNGNDWLVTEQPGFNFTFTKNNFSAYTYYDYKRTKLNMSRYRFINMRGQHVRTEDVSIDKPGDIYSNYSNHLVMGANYRINPNHAISLENDYIFTNSSSENRYIINKTPEYFPGDYLYNDTTTTKLKDKNYRGTLFYKGHINDNIRLYSDLSYNYYSDDVDNHYRQTMIFEERNIFKEKKNQLMFNLEGDFRIIPQHAFTIGYSNNWRKYGSDSFAGEKFIDYKEFRNKFFFYFVSNINEHIQTKIGSSFDHIRISSLEYKNTQFTIQPHVQIGYSPNEDLNIGLSYVTNSDNPTLSQLSIMPITLDTIVNQIGNPELKTSVNHIFSAGVSYKNRLHFKAEYKHSPNGLCEAIDKINNRNYITFNNIKIQEYSFHFDYNQPFLNHFNWKSSVIYYLDRAKHDGIKNKTDGWLINSEIGYFNPKHDLGIQFGYYKNMSKRIMWQGYQMEDYDKWEITAKKHFWNKQISVMLSYVPPIDLGIHYKQERRFDSPMFIENSYLNMRTFRNMLFLKVEFRINKGKVRKNKEQPTYDIEDKRRLKF